MSATDPVAGDAEMDKLSSFMRAAEGGIDECKCEPLSGHSSTRFNAGSASAQFNLGVCYENGEHGAKRDMKEAARYAPFEKNLGLFGDWA